MAQQDFEDRFTYANPALAGVPIEQLNEEQIAALSPDLVVYSNMVRNHSVLIRNKSLSEIYAACTTISDPRVSLVLAAAKDKNDISLFPDLNLVKAIMFGPAQPTSSEFQNQALNIFVDGVRRVSTALTAAYLINQLAQIPEQFNHAKYLEQSALEDLDRIIKVADAQNALGGSATTQEDESKAFFFENKTINLGNPLICEVYLPSVGLAIGGGASWSIVNTYTGSLNTARLTSDIADKINELTLISGITNLIAAPILAGALGLHCINIQARTRNSEVAYEVITVRFRNTQDNLSETGFRWGIESDKLDIFTVNSNLITVNQGRVASTVVTGLRDPVVLYFKRAPLDINNQVLDYNADIIPDINWQQNTFLEFRISPTQDESVRVPFPWNTQVGLLPEEQLKLDNLRYADIAFLLLNQLFEAKGPTRALGALIRNDDPNQTEPLAAIELVAFSVTNPESWLILDLIEVPPDILVAVGNLSGPTTQFSSKPRSIRVETRYDSSLTSNSQLSGSLLGANEVFVSSCVEDSFNYVQDQAHKITGRNW